VTVARRNGDGTVTERSRNGHGNVSEMKDLLYKFNRKRDVTVIVALKYQALLFIDDEETVEHFYEHSLNIIVTSRQSHVFG